MFGCGSDYQLSRKVVQNIHLSGGSLLGVSRGGPSVAEIVDSMEVLNLLFPIVRHFFVCLRKLLM